MSSTEPPAIKGLHFVGQTQAIKLLSSLDHFKQMEQALPLETRQLIEHPPLAADWIPMQHRYELHKTARVHCFDGDVTKFFEVGKLTAKHTTKLAYRAFIKFMSPEQVAKRASTLWKMITRNNGELTYAETGAKALSLHYSGLFQTNDEYWEFVRGNLTYFMESTGVKDVSVTLTSGGGEQPEAKFAITWR